MPVMIMVITPIILTATLSIGSSVEAQGLRDQFLQPLSCLQSWVLLCSHEFKGSWRVSSATLSRNQRCSIWCSAKGGLGPGPRNSNTLPLPCRALWLGVWGRGRFRCTLPFLTLKKDTLPKVRGMVRNSVKVPGLHGVLERERQSSLLSCPSSGIV